MDMISVFAGLGVGLLGLVVIAFAIPKVREANRLARELDALVAESKARRRPGANRTL